MFRTTPIGTLQATQGSPTTNNPTPIVNSSAQSLLPDPNPHLKHSQFNLNLHTEMTTLPTSTVNFKDIQVPFRHIVGNTNYKAHTSTSQKPRSDMLQRQVAVKNGNKSELNSRVFSPISTSLLKVPDAPINHMSNYRRRQFGSFSIGENKSYQELDTAADRSRLYPQNLSVLRTTNNKASGQLSGKRAMNSYSEDIARLNEDLRSLSQLLQGKTRLVNRLTDELSHKQSSLLEANQNVQLCLSKLNGQDNYGVESRKKLRCEIDYLKECYVQLLRRVDAETFPEVNHGRTKEQTMRESFDQLKHSTNKMSVNTASVT